MTDPSSFTPFGAQLEPVLLAACDGRLGGLHWFRTDWQRGGALTGYAAWRGDDGSTEPVVVKLPVPPQELRWLKRLQPDEHAHGDVVPRLYAGDTVLGGYDLAWVVMERLPHGPLGPAWNGAQWPLMVEAIGRFYAAASQTPVDREPDAEDWPGIVKRARKAVKEQSLPFAQRWNGALKKLNKKLGAMLEQWDARDAKQWRHGDAHPANAMTRNPPPGGPALLFDFAEVRPGNWIEDAVYLEHLFWARRDLVGDYKITNGLAQQRRALELPVEDHWAELANVRRVLVAASAPAYLRQEGSPAHLNAALDVLESTLGQV